VLIDYPGFNLTLARLAKSKSIPVVYYVSPQVWAWGTWRVKSIERYVDHLLCILPFERDFYEDYAVTSTFVGHPLFDLIKPTMSRADFFAKHRLSKEKTLIGFLPGSRSEEIRRILPIMMEVKERLGHLLDSQFILILFPGVSNEVKKILKQADAHIGIVENEKHEAIKYADLLLCTSGTVTLESLILGTPMLILYKVSFISWLMGKLLVKIPHIGLVNIIAGRELAKEFVQFGAKPERLVNATLELLAVRDKVRSELNSVRGKLGDRGAARRAATVIQGMLTRCS